MTDSEEAVTGTDVEELENQHAGIHIDAANNSGLVVANARDIYNTINKQVKGLREATELGQDLVHDVLTTFVERAFMTGQQMLDSEQVAEKLREQHCVVLIGEPDTGRRTAAIAVLGRLQVPLEQIPGWDPGQPGQFTVADLPAERGTGYLFVHPDDELASAEFGDELRAYREKLTVMGSFLVVVATATAWHAAGGGSTGLVLTVGGPDRRELLERAVRTAARHRDLAPVFTSARIDASAAKATPREVVRLATLVIDLADTPTTDLDSDAGLGRIIDEIVDGYQNWDERLTVWFREHPAADERLFLLAAAVLEGSPARRILRYAEDLGTSLGGAQPGRHTITAAGVRELVAKIDAEIVGDDRRLQFRRPAYAIAVLDHFLSDRSDAFRIQLRNWLAQVPKQRFGAETEVADLVAGTVLGITRRHRDVAFVTPIVDAWAVSRTLRPVLVSLLTGLALSSEVGAATRARLNWWATQSTRTHLWQVVADVCAGDLADAYPRIALTRINNLAVRARGEFVPIVVAAVVKLWERPALRRQVLERVIGWLVDPGQPAFAVGAEALAVLGSETVEVAFLHRVDATTALSTAVGNMLQSPDRPERLRDTLYGWLDLAVTDPSLAEWLIAVVASAVPGTGSALRVACVRTFSYGWESREIGTQRAGLRERLVDRVNAADPTIRHWAMAVERKGARDEWAA